MNIKLKMLVSGGLIYNDTAVFEEVLLTEKEIEQLYITAVTMKNKIGAIRDLRMMYQCYLREAKDCIEYIMDNYETQKKLELLKEILS